MAEKIKKTIPWFLILALIGLVIGVSLNLGKPQAEAEGVPATVEVGNVAPDWHAIPYEDPTCHSGSGKSGTTGNPVDAGQGLDIKAEATDDNGDQWYLVICDGENPPTGAGVANCASGTTYGKSSLTNQGEGNIATATVSTTGMGNQSYAWYGYACDSATTNKCSALSQGSGESGTPFYVNHAPAFTAVATTNPGGGNGNPGTTFTITTTSSDGDTGGGADTLTAYVCDTNAHSGIGCAADHELCHATTHASPNVDCDYEDIIPTPDQQYTYYAFVWDNHEFAGNSGSSQNNTYTIDNVLPTITSVSLNGGSLIQLNIKPNTTNVAAVSTDVSDNNGYGDITGGATAVIYRTTKGASCGANANNCYQVATGNCVQSAGSGATCTYTCTATFKYYADPTDGSSGYDDTWSAKITASDEVGSGYKIGDTPVELKTNIALDVAEAGINYDVVPAGGDTGGVNETTTVANYGNSPIDTNLYGIDMTKVGDGVFIAVEQQKYALAGFTYSSGGTALLESPGVDVNTETTKPTDDNAVSDNVLWGIGIPEGQATGEYAGSNTFTAAIDGDNWPL
jgi:hypothetical protein